MTDAGRSLRALYELSVVCCWEWDAGRWAMAGAYPEDGDGHALSPPFHGNLGRSGWQAWCNERAGRIVTLWAVASGVRLADWNPADRGPVHPPNPIALASLPDWPLWLDGGVSLRTETAREAARYLTERGFR